MSSPEKLLKRQVTVIERRKKKLKGWRLTMDIALVNGKKMLAAKV